MPLSRNTSPAPGQRSSCASTSEALAKQCNGGPSDQEDEDGNGNEHEDEIPTRMDTDQDHDTISGLSDPTPCALMHNVGGHRAKVAWGTVYPRQFELHTVPINVEFEPDTVPINVECVCLHLSPLPSYI